MHTNEKLEEARIAAVKALNILDTEPESPFDDAVNLAAVICGTPISLITLLDGKRQWFKAKVGMTASETPQEQAFCAHAIRGRELFVVPNALNDMRFQDNPLVTSDPHIRFYAGMPLYTPEGHALGTLCVIDTIPRELTVQQKNALALLSRQVFGQLRLRNQLKGLRQVLAEKSRIEESRIGSNALFQAFMDHSPLVAYVKDARGRLIYYNQLFAERFNITRNEWLDKDDFEIWPEEFAAHFRAVDLDVLASGESTVSDESSPGPGGSTIYWRSYKFCFIDATGERLLAGVSLDISAEKSAEIALKKKHEQLHKAIEQLRELSVTDALTGLTNRRGFDERLQREFNIATRYESILSVLLLDVDNFKSFNDSFGHGEGDKVLCSIAELLLGAARVSDLVCRYGGEEIALLLPNTDATAAAVLAERICACIATAPWEHRPVTVSVGVATIAPGVLQASTLVRRADLALYEAKALGKNRVAPYEPSLERGFSLAV